MFAQKHKATSIFLLLLWALTLVNCSAGSATTPQVSLPIPNDPIEISSPNAEGFVIISAPDETVPNQSVVVIEVQQGIARLQTHRKSLFDNILPLLVPTANAQTACTSTLPACPTLNSTNQCQIVANSQGAFETSIPAGQNDSISISYLNPVDGCNTKVVSSGKSPDANTHLLATQTQSAYWIPGTQTLLVAGLSSSQAPSLTTINTSTKATDSIQSLSSETSNQSIVGFELDSAGTQQTAPVLYLTSSTQSFIGQYPRNANDDSLSESFMPLFDNTSQARQMNYLGFATPPLADSGSYCPLDSNDVNTPPESSVFTRAFFANGSNKTYLCA